MSLSPLACTSKFARPSISCRSEKVPAAHHLPRVSQFSCRDPSRFVTELLHSNVSSVTRGASDEFGMAGAVKFPGLVKSPGLVVGSADAGQRRKYRGLVRAVPPAPGTAGRQSRQCVRHRAHAPPLRGLCFWLRIQLVPSARGCSADLPVRHVAVERCRRPVGRNRGRDSASRRSGRSSCTSLAG